MATIVTTSSTTAGTNIALTAGADLYIAPLAVRASSGGTAISAPFTLHAIDILGSVYGDVVGLSLGTSATTTNSSTVTLGDSASLVARATALSSRGVTISVFNDGLVKGATGIDHIGGTFSLVNTGTILGTSGHALDIDSSQGRVTNYGVISSLRDVAIVLDNTTTLLPSVTIVNYGTISGAGAIESLGTTREIIDNQGLIVSNIVLGAGDDYYDGHAGIVDGAIFGADGNDTILGGAGREDVRGGNNADSIEGAAGNDWLNGEDGDDTIDGGDGNDLIRPGAGADLIDGGDGLRDLLDYSLGAGPVTVDLATGDVGGGDAAGDIITGIEDVLGTFDADVLTGNSLVNRLSGRFGGDLISGAAGNDVLAGDEGADTLIGGTGADVLRGGTGADLFRLAVAADSGATGGLRDRIVDFDKVELDRIDLSALDANATLAGNQAFVFNGAAAFTAAGQVRIQAIGGNTFVFGNTDAVNGTAEFSIVLNGIVALTATDFVL